MLLPTYVFCIKKIENKTQQHRQNRPMWLTYIFLESTVTFCTQFKFQIGLKILPKYKYNPVCLAE